ncbi:hypothetical protein ACNOYE_33400 [Nannocystaceae bacterium ST9]
MTEMLFEVELAGGRAERTYTKLLAPLAGDLDQRFPWHALDPSRYEPALVERARIGWTENAFNEFCTATAMGQLVETMGRANVPIDLWGIAASFPLEELLHVELCSRVAMRLGGGAPIVYDPATLVLEFEPGLTPLQQANELIVRLCCVGEVFSLPMLAGSMKAATNPLTRAVLQQIVKDEAMHGKLGWMYLDWVAPSLDADERARLARAANDTAAGVRRIWEGRRIRPIEPATTEPATTDRSDMGWMNAADYLERASATLADEVFGRLASYGIA